MNMRDLRTVAVTKMDRREFLAATAGAAVAAAAPPPARIPIGFLGAAHSHAIDKVKVVLESPDFEMVGACEESPAARAALEKLGVKLLDRGALLDRCRAVAVESAVRDHAAGGRLAVEAGKHVHLEKPPAATAREFRDIVAIARAKSLVLQMGYMWRHNPGFLALLEAARKGWLGDVFSIRASMNTLVPAERRPEWAEFRGGAMFEQGCHLIDAIVRLLGRPTAVTSFLKKHGAGADTLADNAVAVLEYPRALAVVFDSTLQPSAFPHRLFEVQGSAGTGILKPIEPPALLLDLAGPAGPYREGSQAVPLPAYRRFVADFAELAAAVRGERPLATTFDEDLAVHETVIRAGAME